MLLSQFPIFHRVRNRRLPAKTAWQRGSAPYISDVEA